MKILLSESQLKRLVESTTPGCSGIDDCTKKWSVINQNKEDKRAFGSGQSQNETVAKEKAISNARVVLSEKLSSNTITNMSVIEEKLFQKSDGMYVCLVIIGI